MTQTAAQHFIEEGREIGAVETMQKTLIKLLNLKFGSIPQSVIQHIQTLRDIAQLDRLIEQIMTANSLQEMGIE